jgi:anti-sigma regulatory factor (Ser/Thr protein kinase)
VRAGVRPRRIWVHVGMQLRVFPSVEAPSQARRELASLASRIDKCSLADVRTVISELVGMSVVNGARKPIEVELCLDDGHLEGVLRDDGIGARAISRRDSTSLVVRIVDALVEEWGATSDGERRIWFRMNVRPV